MGPLKGMRIVEMAGIGPAPVCGMLLADMGADVILVERKLANPNDSGLASDTDPRTRIFNRGKRSLAIDLKQPGAGRMVLELLRPADALIESFRPGVMERLGLGPEPCLDINPRLVYGRLSGWGQTGPLADEPGHDLNYLALAGALNISGPAGGPPEVPATLVGDVGGGAMFLMMGVLAALLAARDSGEGQVVDAAIADGAAAMTTLILGLRAAGLWSAERGGNLLDGGSPWYNTYVCADGAYITLAALEPEFHAALLAGLGLERDPAYADPYDRERWPGQKAGIAALLRQRSRDEWCEHFEGRAACVAPVLDFAAAAEHPHNRARGTYVELDGVLQPAPAPKFSATPASVDAPPPRCGEHTDALLAEAGLTAAQIAAYRDAGSI